MARIGQSMLESGVVLGCFGANVFGTFLVVPSLLESGLAVNPACTRHIVTGACTRHIVTRVCSNQIFEKKGLDLKTLMQ